MKIILSEDVPKEKQLEMMRYHLENYYEGLDDPLGCEPACRVSEIEENPSCDKCIKDMIDHIIDTLDKKEEFTFYIY